MTAPEPRPHLELPPEVDEIRSKLPGLLLFVAILAYFGVSASLPTVLMVLGLVVTIFLHETGHYLTAKAAGMKVTEFFLGFGPRLWSFRRGETEYGLKLVPAGAYVRIIGMSNLDEVDPADEERTYRAKPYWRRMSVAVAGSSMHFILALLLAWSVFSAFGLPDPDSTRWTIGTVTAGSPAQEVGLLPGDRLVSVEGTPVADFDETSARFRGNRDRPVTLVVERAGRALTLEPTLSHRRDPSTGKTIGFLGVSPHFPTRRWNPVAGFGKGVQEFGTVAKGSVTGLRQLFSASGVTSYVDHLTGRAAKPAAGTVDTGRPSSVVGIVQAGGEVGHDGLVNIVYLLFGVNVFFGIFNMAPLLPFDGGHVVIATYEKVRSMRSGRRYQADVAKLMPLTYLVVLVLGFLFVTSIYMDIADPLSIR